jgi:hypothetical protein
MSLARTVMADNIITLLKASTKTNLAALDDNAIIFGNRLAPQIFSLTYQRGILVFIGSGTVTPLNMGASKKDVIQLVRIMVYVIGYDPTADQKLAAALLEEVEEVLWANMTLTGGGTIMDEPSVEFYLPVAQADLTLHWAVMDARYQKTGT